MILSRVKPDVAQGSDVSAPNLPKASSKQFPKIDDFLEKRDYTGAIAILEFEGNSTGSADKSWLERQLWLGYCNFHLGDYRRSLQIYETLIHSKDAPPEIYAFQACTLFFLGRYQEAMEAAEKAPSSQLRYRLQFHLAHKLNDEERLMECHKQLEDIIEDQLSLASIHYLRAHYQEGIDIYKKVLLDNRELLALNVYVALCYYKLDYYDVSQEVLAAYLQRYPDSAVALNLKACNHFKLYNGKAAEVELKQLLDNSSLAGGGRELIRHNLVVFRQGEGALQTLPALVDVVAEARLNLAIWHLRCGEVREAFDLMRALEPSVPHEYVLKGVVHAALGQETANTECIKLAEQYFQLVGGSQSECDTIPGRQCMASALFLLRQFSEVLVYLNSIKSYYYNDDAFNFNYGQAKCATGAYREAEEALAQVRSERLRHEYAYICNLARCYVMNGKPQSAWDLYVSMETSPEAVALLQQLADDCYRAGHFWQSARALDALERLDPTPERWEGKRGACCALFQQVVAGQRPPETLAEVVQLLRNSPTTQVEPVIRGIKAWAKENRINV